MKKKGDKIFDIVGDIWLAGMGVTGIYLLTKMMVWNFSEFENHLKK